MTEIGLFIAGGLVTLIVFIGVAAGAFATGDFLA